MHKSTLLGKDEDVRVLYSCLREGESLRNVPGLLKKIIRDESWRERELQRTHEIVGFRNFRQFVESPPPEGLGTTINLLIDICQTYEDTEAILMISQAETGTRGGNNNPNGLGGKSGKMDRDIVNVNNINIDNDRSTMGTATTYTMRRLAKDAPELLTNVLSGEMTANAAAIKAGFRKRKMQVPEDAEAAGRYLAKRVDSQWLSDMLESFKDAANE